MAAYLVRVSVWVPCGPQCVELSVLMRTQGCRVLHPSLGLFLLVSASEERLEQWVFRARGAVPGRPGVTTRGVQGCCERSLHCRFEFKSREICSTRPVHTPAGEGRPNVNFSAKKVWEGRTWRLFCKCHVDDG